jgi:uncharacterized protein YfdQ (DUF2303 family)
MIDKETLQALQEGHSIDAANDRVPARYVAAMPSDYKLHDVEKWMSNRRRAIGSMKTSAVDDFAAYVDQHAETGATVFVNAEAMRAIAVLNLGAPETPGHADNTAEFAPKATAAFMAMNQIANGQPRSQQEVAEFMEDWPSLVSCYNEEGNIANPKAIAAVRKVSIESMRKMESQEKQLSASRSAFESVQATSTEPLPTLIYFETVPYHGLQSRLFVMRLGVRTGGEKPAITLRIQNMEQHNEEMAKELTEIVASEIKEIPVLIGTYTAK